MFYKSAKKRLKDVENQINYLQKIIPTFPKGYLTSSRTGKYFKWFVTVDKKRTYIRKENRKLAEQLAQKKFYLLQLENLLQEQKALNSFFKHYSKKARLDEHQFFTSPEYLNLLKPNYLPLSQELAEWANKPFVSNPKNPEFLNVIGYSGKRLRSKSEQIIDMILFLNKIPYRYESPLSLDNQILYPDFTIRHPKTGEFFYWEHFGMMDDPDYRRKAIYKIEKYIKNGIYPGINLIITTETKDHPLEPLQVANIINSFFLDQVPPHTVFQLFD